MRATLMQFRVSAQGAVYAYCENNIQVFYKDYSVECQGVVEIKPTGARKFKKVVFSTVQRDNWITQTISMTLGVCTEIAVLVNIVIS
ncbi:MAG: hypothetical protein ACRERW_00525 [Pseudomonas sp.]